MNQNTDIHPLQQAAEMRLMADVLELGHLTGKAASVRPIPMVRGEIGQRFIAIGTPAQVRALLADATPTSHAAQAGIDLDKLEALARAADAEAHDRGEWFSVYQLADGITLDASAALMAAANPTAVLELISLARNAAQDASATDERALFEAWYAPMFGQPKLLGDSDQYQMPSSQGAWQAWQARAALAQQADVFKPCTSNGVEFKNSRNLNINDTASPVPAAQAVDARRVMFAAYSRCIGDDRLSPDQIADVLLSVTSPAPETAQADDVLVLDERKLELWWKYVRACKDARESFLSYEEWLIQEAAPGKAAAANAGGATDREAFVDYWKQRFQYSPTYQFLDRNGDFCTPEDDPIHMNWVTWLDARVSATSAADAKDAAADDELPTLPRPIVSTRHGTPCYTVGQMMDYAREAIAHAAAICDGVAAKSKNSLFRSGAKICASEIRATQAGADQADSEGGHHD